MKSKKKWYRKIILLPLLLIWICGCSRRPDVTAVGFAENCETQAGQSDESGNVESQEIGISAGDRSGEEAGTTQDGSGEESPATVQSGSGEESLGTAQTGRIVVHVCGAVEHPGIYSLYEGARVYEAVEAAGGFRKDADQEWLNQAALLKDGEKLKISTAEETAQWKAQGMTEPEGVSGTGELEPVRADGEKAEKVNLNTAAREELMTLPGIGESKADAVIAYREEHGKFQKIEDIMEISGIKDAVFLKIKDKITV